MSNLLHAIALQAMFCEWRRQGRIRQRWEVINIIGVEVSWPEMLDRE